uniref:Ribonuclease HII n=1 Tax=viral metagenome TaxID=1070528 RepID=A0A6C0KKH0_9ZZZZ
MLSSRFKQDDIVEIGIDEAGRGSFWGPITAGAVILPDESEWTEKQRLLLVQMRDSKKISPKKRERLAKEIKELIPQHSVGMVHADEINANGIGWANVEAFRRAVQGLPLPDTSHCRIIIDGILGIQGWTGEQELIIEGDSKYVAIAAASILAKVEHDQWIQSYCDNHPDCNERYDLCNSKGYGTAKHREGIRLYGGHELHRIIYIQNWLPGGIQRSKKKPSAIEKTDTCLITFDT